MFRVVTIAVALGALAPSAVADEASLLARYGTNCGALPPASARAEPNVPYRLEHRDMIGLQILCNGAKATHQWNACALRPWPEGNVANGSSPTKWTIIISYGLSSKDEACVTMYEKAHLPPNNWQDDAWEEYINR